MSETTEGDFEVFEAPEAPRRGRRIATLATFAVVLATGGALFSRGTLVDPAPRDPATAAEGTVTQLLLTPEGNRQVRCARVLDHSAAAVWAAITDYDHFVGTFPYLVKAKGEPRGGDAFLFSGLVDTPIGNFEYATTVHHDVAGRRTWWDESGGPFKVNKGSWTVAARDADHTLLVFTLELEVVHYPTFLVNDVLLARLPLALSAVDAKLAKK